MSSQNLIIYKFTELYHILEELSLDLNFKIILENNEKFLNEKVKNLNNYLILSNKKYPNIENQLVFNNTPINIFKLVEKVNIEFLKLQFNIQSEFKVNSYTINLNSRELYGFLKLNSNAFNLSSVNLRIEFSTEIHLSIQFSDFLNVLLPVSKMYCAVAFK